jgi:hypothetical protein
MGGDPDRCFDKDHISTKLNLTVPASLLLLPLNETIQSYLHRKSSTAASFQSICGSFRRTMAFQKGKGKSILITPSVNHSPIERCGRLRSNFHARWPNSFSYSVFNRYLAVNTRCTVLGIRQWASKTCRGSSRYILDYILSTWKIMEGSLLYHILIQSKAACPL